MANITAVIISGSERRFGVTANISKLLKEKLEELGCSVKIFYLCDYNISACDGCGTNENSCNYRSEPCEKNDDTPLIVDSMIGSDIIIYTCPVHAFGASHLMQIFLERSGVGYLRFKRLLANKIGGCVIIGRRYNLGNVHDQIVNNMLLNRIIVPGSGFPVLIHGDEKTKMTNDAEEIVAINQFVERLVEIHRSINYTLLTKDKKNERELKEITENMR